MKFNGTSWEKIGIAFTSSIISSLALDSNGRPYVACLDNYWNASVMRFNGTDWEQVGASGFIPIMVDNTSIAIDISGTPYIAYANSVYDKWQKLGMMKFNGTTWEQVGAGGNFYGYNLSLSIDSRGTPYIAYGDWCNDWKASVIRFTGTNWEQVGISPNAAESISLFLDSRGTPYVSYSDAGNGWKASVIRFVTVSLQPIYQHLLMKKR